MKKLFTLLIAVFLLSACTKKDNNPSNKNPLANTDWEYKPGDGHYMTMDFNDDNSGYYVFNMQNSWDYESDKFTYTLSGVSLVVTTPNETLNGTYKNGELYIKGYTFNQTK